MTWIAGGLLVFISTTATLAASQDTVTLAELIRPGPQEQKWLQIPWLTDLWEARKQASESGKPILLWEMDGNPLGCT